MHIIHDGLFHDLENPSMRRYIFSLLELRSDQVRNESFNRSILLRWKVGISSALGDLLGETSTVLFRLHEATVRWDLTCGLNYLYKFVQVHTRGTWAEIPSIFRGLTIAKLIVMVVQNLLRCLRVDMILKIEFIELLHTITIIETSKPKEDHKKSGRGKRQEVNEEAQPRHGGGSRPYLLVWMRDKIQRGPQKTCCVNQETCY